MCHKETKMMLVGSKALLHHFPTMRRKSHDTDYFTTDESKVGVDGDIEIHYVPESVIPYTDVISANDLFTLKISHAVRDINFKKHFNDIKFMIKHGCQVNKPLLKRLVPFWEELHGERRMPNFDKKNEEFFKDKVERGMSHDELHHHFMYGEQPMYMSIKRDMAKASVEVDMFHELSEEDKHKIILEEAFVIAYERFVGKDRRKYPPRYAYSLALEALITRLFPVEISIYALEHFFDYDVKYKDFIGFLNKLK